MVIPRGDKRKLFKGMDLLRRLYKEDIYKFARLQVLPTDQDFP